MTNHSPVTTNKKSSRYHHVNNERPVNLQIKCKTPIHIITCESTLTWDKYLNNYIENSNCSLNPFESINRHHHRGITKGGVLFR